MMRKIADQWLSQLQVGFLVENFGLILMDCLFLYLRIICLYIFAATVQLLIPICGSSDITDLQVLYVSFLSLSVHVPPSASYT
jgi:hypothetical protein